MQHFGRIYDLLRYRPPHTCLMVSRLFFVLVIFILPVQQSTGAPQAATDPSQMSVAERAAAAKAARENRPSRSTLPQLTPEQHGRVTGDRYINEYFHFQLRFGTWEQIDALRASHSEAVGRELLNPNAGSSPYRVLWLADGMGRNV